MCIFRNSILFLLWTLCKRFWVYGFQFWVFKLVFCWVLMRGQEVQAAVRVELIIEYGFPLVCVNSLSASGSQLLPMPGTRRGRGTGRWRGWPSAKGWVYSIPPSPTQQCLCRAPQLINSMNGTHWGNRVLVELLLTYWGRVQRGQGGLWPSC